MRLVDSVSSDQLGYTLLWTVNGGNKSASFSGLICSDISSASSSHRLEKLNSLVLHRHVSCIVERNQEKTD